MALEVWILLALVGAGVALGVVNRLRGRTRGKQEEAGNIYTLW